MRTLRTRRLPPRNGSPTMAKMSMKTQKRLNVRVRAIASWYSASAGDAAERGTDGESADGEESRGRTRSCTVSARGAGGGTRGDGEEGAGRADRGPPAGGRPSPRLDSARGPSWVGSSSAGRTAAAVAPRAACSLERRG